MIKQFFPYHLYASATFFPLENCISTKLFLVNIKNFNLSINLTLFDIL